MNKEGLISVIVPVYNQEKYLDKCINSILNQTYKDIEIIIINDGSTDTSGEICDNYALRYSNVKVFHQKNQGLSMARNNGLKKANGKYISFIDSDDHIDIDMYEVLIKFMIEYDLDIINCNFHDKSPEFNINGEFAILNKAEAVEKALKEIYITATNKLYKKDILSENPFIKGFYYEDVGSMYKIYTNINKLGIINKRLYTNTYNPKSISRDSFTLKHRNDYFIISKNMLEFAENTCPSAISVCKGRLIKSALSLLTVIYAKSTNIEEAKNNPLYKDVAEVVYNYRNDEDVKKYLNLKYKIFFNSFGKVPIIHFIMAKISSKSKKSY